MKNNLNGIATFILLLTAMVSTTFAQNRGGQIINGLERLERRASSKPEQDKTTGENLVPDSLGWLDPTFGTGGRVITKMTDDNYTRQMRIQPDGKIVALGDIANPLADPYDIGLARYRLDAPAPPPFFDFDGDGRTDLAIYRDGNWWIQRSSNNAVSVTQFGLSTDIPVQTAY